MVDVLGGEVLEDADTDAFVGSDSEVGYRPVRAVASGKGNLIARLDTELLKEHMQAQHLDRQFAKTILMILIIIGQRRIVPLMRHHGCQIVQIMLGHNL